MPAVDPQTMGPTEEGERGVTQTAAASQQGESTGLQAPAQPSAEQIPGPGASSSFSFDPPGQPYAVEQPVLHHAQLPHQQPHSFPFYPMDDFRKLQIKTQVEYYFSPQNLSKDTFMISKMDGEGYIPISIITNFKKLKSLLSIPREVMNPDQGFDTELEQKQLMTTLIELLEGGENPICELSEDKLKIRPRNYRRPERTTIILREVSQSVDEETINVLLKDFNILDVKRDVVDTWFVRLSNEDAAKDALSFVRFFTFS